MDGQKMKASSRSKDKAADVAAVLRKSWYHLRLSVRHPARVPTWDAIVLTAASPQQAQLYEWQLSRAKRIGRISPSTVTLAVPDADGQRIGSGAATLNAIYALASHYDKLGLFIHDSASVSSPSPLPPIVRFIASKHILLLHAGGDSKRVPWANPMGKVFLPLPYLASDDPDGPVPLLFDHILAIASCARQALAKQGGMFTMTGDVLPCFDASTIVLPDDAPSIITVPVTLDVAANHGVIVASNNSRVACQVDNLLQKPSIEELVKNQAILDDGRTLLDTGLIAVRGKAWTELVMLAYSCPSMIAELVKSRKEVSLYEDLVAAWVPAKHDWLRERPLGEELVSRLGKYQMFSYCANEMSFLHFGTSGEVLDHFTGFGSGSGSGSSSGIVGRRHLCSIPATTVSDIAASAVVLSSKIEPGVSVGEDSLIYDSYISSQIQIGSQCIVVSVNIKSEEIDVEGGELLFRFMLPDRHCLWEVPLVGSTERVLVFCGLHDNPKNSVSKGGGTFCGKPWKRVLQDLCIDENDLWCPTVVRQEDKCLWNAKLFPVVSSYSEMLNLATWLMMGLQEHDLLLPLWKGSRRVSLEELHRSIDFLKMCVGSSNHQAELAAGIAKACIKYGLLGRNLYQLCDEILQMREASSGVGICKDLLRECLQKNAKKIVPQSRVYQVQVDLLRACGDEVGATELEDKVWAAVADETASAVMTRYAAAAAAASWNISRISLSSLDQTLFHPRRITVELPVRVDFVGGWSDTPPWSLERAGCVLNMAVSLEGSLPIGAVVETRKEKGITMSDDMGRTLDIHSIVVTHDIDDPFRLVKSALVVTGILDDDKIMGLRIRTWANVPRGSGLGTSSILAAAVVKALVHVMDGDSSNENVARLVLLLEQIMGTGGGWQDQIGGLYPGIKFTSSFPGVTLRLEVVPVLASPHLISQLHQRLLLVFTGQVRLAHQVLHKVVRRYLRRDNLLVSSIKRLAELAKIGREALMNGEVDEVGEIMMEAWRLHQELDPYCSNDFVDKLFAIAQPYCCGYKLVGAGGGGFALFLAKDEACAKELHQLLSSSSTSSCLEDNNNVRVYNWQIITDKLS